MQQHRTTAPPMAHAHTHNNANEIGKASTWHQNPPDQQSARSKEIIMAHSSADDVGEGHAILDTEDFAMC